MKNKENVLWGIVFLALGLVLALKVLGIIEMDIFFDGWWTLIIIIPALINVILHPTKLWPYVWAIIGFVLLLMARGVLDWSIVLRMIFPVALILIGVTLIFSNIIDKKIASKSENVENSSIKTKSVVFGERTFQYGNMEFLGDNLECSFGYIRCFMHDVVINENQILNINVSFGKADIFVPKNVNVVVVENATLGAVNNKNLNTIEENRPTLTINASCSFGGINII